jgi:hypothetical protein
MELLEILLIFAVGYVVGKLHTYLVLTKMIREVAEEQGIDLHATLEKYAGVNEEEIEEDKIRQLLVEKHGELLYLFDKKTDQFICQGASVQELAKLALEQKNINIAAVLYNKTFFKFVDGVSTESDVQVVQNES